MFAVSPVSATRELFGQFLKLHFYVFLLLFVFSIDASLRSSHPMGLMILLAATLIPDFLADSSRP